MNLRIFDGSYTSFAVYPSGNTIENVSLRIIFRSIYEGINVTGKKTLCPSKQEIDKESRSAYSDPHLVWLELNFPLDKKTNPIY